MFGIDGLSFDGGAGGGAPSSSCDNGVQDGSETDVDCGGGDCKPCPLGLDCEQPSDCISFVCRLKLCSACNDPSDCPGLWLCDPANGACVDGKPNGFLCQDDAECHSGFCPPQDGVCCDSACALSCEACLQEKTGVPSGTCDFVNPDLAPDPDGECPAEDPSTCGHTGLGCSGFRSSCALHDETTLCQAGSCANGVATPAALCDGDGSCVVPDAQPCSPYGCAANSCLTSCLSQSDCVSSHYCDSNQACVAKKAAGSACAGNNECSSGICSNGLCD